MTAELAAVVASHDVPSMNRIAYFVPCEPSIDHHNHVHLEENSSNIIRTNNAPLGTILPGKRHRLWLHFLLLNMRVPTFDRFVLCTEESLAEFRLDSTQLNAVEQTERVLQQDKPYYCPNLVMLDQPFQLPRVESNALPMCQSRMILLVHRFPLLVQVSKKHVTNMCVTTNSDLHSYAIPMHTIQAGMRTYAMSCVG